MLLIEALLSVIAPHECLGCNREDSLLCELCAETFLDTVPDRCYVCLRMTRDSAVCASCRRNSSLRHVWVTTEYDGLAKSLIRRFKYERAREAYKPIAKYIADTLPYIQNDTVITHLPTATSRHRMRGYDQAQLIARQVAKLTGASYRPLLERTGQERQVGSTRKQRIEQAGKMFYAKDEKFVIGRTVLIIDDIVTTGASLEAAARHLRASGAKQVNAAVFAQKH